MKCKELFARTEILLGEEGMEALRNASVLIFGVGGVGSYAAEAIARCGVGRMTLVDADTVSVSNVNRQLIADLSTVGMKKVEAEKRRILAVNPDCEVTLFDRFVLPENIEDFHVETYGYVLDCIDTVSAKIAIVEKATAAGVKVISAMGAGNKLHPERLELGDISKTTVCPLARVMRTELRKRGIVHLPVVFSTEEPVKHKVAAPLQESGKPTPGSVSFVPSAAGLLMASKVIRDLTGAT